MKFCIHILLVVLFLFLANAEMGATNIGNNYSRGAGIQYTEVSRDHLHRLVSASSSGTLFDESFQYDKMGNITGLTRTAGNISSSSSSGYEQIDGLSLSYNGNQLLSISDSYTSRVSAGFIEPSGVPPSGQAEYAYNANGAQTEDWNRGVMGTVYYAPLNLPRHIQFKNGHSIDYRYDAQGGQRKIKYTTQKTVVNVDLGTTTIPAQPAGSQLITETDYCGHIIYENGKLKRILHREGYLTKTTKYDYYYYLKDHLGNNRVVTKWTGSGYTPSSQTILQATNYYPSGLPYGEQNCGGSYSPGVFNPSAQPYKFGGKEYETMYGLNQYYQGFRLFGSDLPITPTQDPRLEKYYDTSPYVQYGNNPIRYVDPDGKNIKNPAHWVQFAKNLYRASTAVASVGLQVSANVDVSVAKVGVDINAGSVDLVGVRNGTFTPNENTPQVSQGVDVNVGIVSFSTGTTVTDTGQSTITENSISVGVSVFESYQTETTETDQATNQSITTTETGVKAADMKVQVALGFGVELSIDTEKAAKALHDLLTTE